MLVSQGGLGRSLSENFVEFAAGQSVVARHHCGNASEALSKLRTGTIHSFSGYYH